MPELINNQFGNTLEGTRDDAINRGWSRRRQRRNPPRRWPSARFAQQAQRRAADPDAENSRTDPLDFLTRVMDDDRLQMRDRVSAGIALMPYFHVRLSVMKVVPNVMTMPDEELLRLMEQISERLGPTPVADRSRALADQVERLIDDVAELSPRRQRDSADPAGHGQPRRGCRNCAPAAARRRAAASASAGH